MLSVAAGRPSWASIGIGVITAASFCLASVPVGADVRSSTSIQAYSVGGTTAASLVSYMKSNPFHGDRGAAVANIRPNYSLSVITKDNAGICQASNVNLNIRFVMTLPKARTPASMSAGTKSAWNAFVAFAKKHEETHRGIYMGCANIFVAKALRLTSANGCFALQANVRKLLDAERRACDKKQNAFDLGEYRRVFGLSLFAMAKYTNRKPTRIASKKPAAADSRSIVAPSD